MQWCGQPWGRIRGPAFGKLLLRFEQLGRALRPDKVRSWSPGRLRTSSSGSTVPTSVPVASALAQIRADTAACAPPLHQKSLAAPTSVQLRVPHLLGRLQGVRRA